MPNPYGHTASGQFQSQSGYEAAELGIPLTVYIDRTHWNAQMALLVADITGLNANVEVVKTKIKKNKFRLIQLIQSSYMMIYGFSRILGGGMSQVFFSIHGATTAAIATYKSIATAITASGPWGWIQASIMFASLGSALISLKEVMGGQKKIGRTIRGITTGLHGLGGVIHSMGLY